MLASRRVLCRAPRLLHTVRSRSIAPLSPLSTASSAAATATQPAPANDPTPTPPEAPSAAAAPKIKTVASAQPPRSTISPPAPKHFATKPVAVPPPSKPTTYGWAAANSRASKPVGTPAAVEEAARAVDWTTSFYGVGTQPVTKEQYDILVRPLEIDDIEVKPDGIIYLPEIKYRRRLNEAFGPMGWGLIPRGEAAVGDSIVTREYALVVNGRFASQAQGENNYFGADQLPSAVEGCKSNALMRTCKDLGIASELWDPQFITRFKKQHMQEVWVEHQTTKKKRTLWYRKDRVDVAYPYKLVSKK